jgi:tetratricopeptide (TPR) repeat protein
LDESSLRSYFRKVLGVQPGASRKEIRQSRDKRAQRWRMMLPQAGVEIFSTDETGRQKLAESRLAITNIAYDSLTNADKFREAQSRIDAGELTLPDLDEMMLVLGESNIKPPAPRVLAKRQALLQEKMERIVTLVTEAVQSAGHDQALKMMQGKLPDADRFYDAVYKAARDAGSEVCRSEIAALAKDKLELDETFQSEVESVIVDQAEMVAHKEYDRLEEKAASTVTKASTTPRVVAGMLSLVIMGLVVSVCFYGATSQPTATPTVANGSKNLAVAPNLDAATAPVHVPADSIQAGLNGAGAPAPAAGIANSVFNRSVFGPNSSDSTQPTPAADVAATQNGTTQQAAQPASVPAAVLNKITSTQVNNAEAISEYTIKTTPVPDKIVAMGVALLDKAGPAGMAGYPQDGKKGVSASYAAGLDAAMKQSYEDSLRAFRQYFSTTGAKEALYNEAIVLGLQGQLKPAVDAYSKALAIDPSLPQALYNRALTHDRLADAAWQANNTFEWRRQLFLSIQNYDLASQVDPRMSQAYYNRGIAHFRLNKNELSYDDFNKARSLMPESMQSATYNRDLVGFFLKRNANVPSPPAPPPPIGPVGPAGPASAATTADTAAKK